MNQREWQRSLDRLAREFGAVLEKTAGGGHFVIRHADGWRVVASGTCSDAHFALKKVRSDVKRSVRRRS